MMYHQSFSPLVMLKQTSVSVAGDVPDGVPIGVPNGNRQAGAYGELPLFISELCGGQGDRA